MAEPDIPTLNPDGLDEVLARAAAEGWAGLALLGLRRGLGAGRLMRSGWPPTRIFLLVSSLNRVPKALARLTGLTALDLRGNQIGDEGAETLSLAAIYEDVAVEEAREAS